MRPSTAYEVAPERNINGLQCQSAVSVAIGAKGLSARLSNRTDPPETQTAPGATGAESETVGWADCESEKENRQERHRSFADYASPSVASSPPKFSTRVENSRAGARIDPVIADDHGDHDEDYHALDEDYHALDGDHLGPLTPRYPVIATLTGDNTYTALGITLTGTVLRLCRQLLELGLDHATPLHAYRGETLAFRVRSIGEGARLVVTSNGRGTPTFAAKRRGVAAPPVEQNQNPDMEEGNTWPQLRPSETRPRPRRE